MSVFTFTGYQSPPRRPLIIPSPMSPFCTSPSQLQEVTFDQDYLSNSIQSPTSGGPMRGRSVKEIEEQLAFLKKDNFNLKLRIYFLEERMGSNFNLDKENIVKKNIELMVDVESLRKELQEKHELLCQAVKAIEIEDDEHKKIVAERDEIVNRYKQEVDELRSQLIESKTDCDTYSHKSYQTSSTGDSSINQNLGGLKEMFDKNTLLQEELNKEKETSAAIQLVLDKKNNIIKSLEGEINDLKMNANKECGDFRQKYDDLMHTYQDLSKRFNEMKQQNEEMLEENSDLRRKYAAMNADLDKERKRYEKLKMASDQQTSDLQCKLESALNELKKSQDLVVSKNDWMGSVVIAPTESDSFSVSQSAASPRSSQTNSNSIPTSIASPLNNVSPATSPCPSVNFNHPHQQQQSPDSTSDVKQLQQKIVKLKAEQMKACKIIKSMIDSRNKSDDEIKLLKFQIKDLKDKLATMSPPSDNNKLKSCSTQVSRSPSVNEKSMAECSQEELGDGEHLIEQYKVLTSDLEEKNKLLLETIEVQKNHNYTLQNAYEQIMHQIKEKDEKLIKLEYELLQLREQAKNTKSNAAINNENVDLQIETDYEAKLEEMQKEVQRLNNELKKKNNDLQTLVNNELWEKNREIEKLQKRHASKIIETKDDEILKLQTELSSKEAQLNVLKWRISELGIEIDEQSGDVQNLEHNLKSELEKSEKLRLQANEVCCVLNTRLEELAVFLDSLLKQKTVLGFLGIKENRRLRQIIDQSLDLSRSLSMSILINNPEQSLLQLTNISSILNDTQTQTEEKNVSIGVGCNSEIGRFSLLPANASLTYHSHLYLKENAEKESNHDGKIVEALRNQIVNLKYELQLRDVELNKLNGGGAEITATATVVSKNNDEFSELSTDKDVKSCPIIRHRRSSQLQQSESEDWSEPDRNVSRERIGLEDASLKSICRKKNMSDETSDTSDDDDDDDEDDDDDDVVDDTNQHSKTTTTTTKSSLLSESRSTILQLHERLCEMDQKLTAKEKQYVEAMMQNKQLESNVNQLEEQLKEAENKKNMFELEVENLQKEKQMLIDSLNEKDADSSKKITELTMKESELLVIVGQAEQAAESAKQEMQEARTKLDNVHVELEKLEKKLRMEYENEFLDKINVIESESKLRIEEIEQQAEKEINSLKEMLKQIELDYAENYIKKSEVEDALSEAMKLSTIIQVLEERMEDLNIENKFNKDKVLEYEERLNELRNSLDNATLQYSEAVLDKTKIANEKTLLEQEINRTVLRENELKQRFDDVDNELACLRHTYQMQVGALQQQKAKFEMKISELEQCNAELHNKLVKIQAGFGDQMLSSSLPTTTTTTTTSNFVTQVVSFRRQMSDNVCGYMYDDNGASATDDLRSLSMGRNFGRINHNHHHHHQHVDVERHEANSSPDLGIESDHGRFSSLETQLNIPRPLLQTLELTESMSNLLDGDNNPVSSVVSCDAEHCCEKTLMMAHENSDLKRKLLRTRRALEETVTQLTLANQRKKQVEKTICKQIHKTSQVLRKAKANLDSGSETDLYKK